MVRWLFIFVLSQQGSGLFLFFSSTESGISFFLVYRVRRLFYLLSLTELSIWSGGYLCSILSIESGDYFLSMGSKKYLFVFYLIYRVRQLFLQSLGIISIEFGDYLFSDGSLPRNMTYCYKFVLVFSLSVESGDSFVYSRCLTCLQRIISFQMRALEDAASLCLFIFLVYRV